MRILWIFMSSLSLFLAFFAAITVLHGAERVNFRKDNKGVTYEIGDRFGWPHPFFFVDNTGDTWVKVRSMCFDVGLLVVLPSVVVTPVATVLTRRRK